ncbi:MAG: hypothetical protein NTW54_03385 [Bacteroidetes bacterium]|nr:hypothetical protein [Bacteroidota bacterium]
MKFFILFSCFAITVSINGQYSLVKSFSQIGNIFNSPIADSTFVFLMQDHDRIIVSEQNKLGDTVSIKIPPINNYLFYGFSVYDSNILFVNYLHTTSFTNITYYTIDRGKNWVAFNPPKNIDAIKFDKWNKKFYFNTLGLTKIYIFNIIQNKLDSITYNSKLVFLDNIQNDKALLYVSDIGLPNEGKISLSTDGAKTYQILTNIDYSKPPFSKTQNGMLEKLVIVTDDYWLAQHTYDSSALNILPIGEVRGRCSLILGLQALCLPAIVQSIYPIKVALRTICTK